MAGRHGAGRNARRGETNGVNAVLSPLVAGYVEQLAGDEITADAHDEDEQLMGFENAFDEDASFPCPGTVIGQEVEFSPSAAQTTVMS